MPPKSPPKTRAFRFRRLNRCAFFFSPLPTSYNESKLHALIRPKAGGRDVCVERIQRFLGRDAK